jgi:hypothetical protein
VSQGVEGHSDVEVILELADEFQHLQRIETEIGQQFARPNRLDRTATDTLENLDEIALDPFS